MLILQAFFNIFKLIWCNYYFFFLGLSANNYEVTFIKITSNKKKDIYETNKKYVVSCDCNHFPFN